MIVFSVISRILENKVVDSEHFTTENLGIITPKVEIILRTGEKEKIITYTYDTEIIIGHKLELDMKIPKKLRKQIKSWIWEFYHTYPQYAVKDYIRTTESGKDVKGKVTELKAEDLKKKSVTFYWIKGTQEGVLRNINLTLKFKNSNKPDIQIQAGVKVKLPEDIPECKGTATGEIRVDLYEALPYNATQPKLFSLIHFGLGESLITPFKFWNLDGQGTPKNYNPGISFTPKATATATFQYLNLIKKDYSIEYHDINNQLLFEYKPPVTAESSPWGLDAIFPYNLNSDSPGVPLNPIGVYSNKIKTIKSETNFKTYLLYKPSEKDSIYVPLKVFKWSWKGSIKNCVWKKERLIGWGNMWVLQRDQMDISYDSEPKFGESKSGKLLAPNDKLPEWNWIQKGYNE